MTRDLIVQQPRTPAAKVSFAWFTADEAYGQAGYLREWLEDHDVFYVMATRSTECGSPPTDQPARRASSGRFR